MKTKRGEQIDCYNNNATIFSVRFRFHFRFIIVISEWRGKKRFNYFSIIHLTASDYILHVGDKSVFSINSVWVRLKNADINRARADLPMPEDV